MPFLAVPISTTHTLVGAVVGVGLAGGASAVDFRVFWKIAASWVASLPVAGIGAVIFFILFAGNPTNVAIVTLLAFGITGYVVSRPSGEVDPHALVVSETPSTIPTVSVMGLTPFELFHNHAIAVEKTVTCMAEAVSVAVSGKDPTKEIEATVLAELDADNIKASLRDEIGKGVMITIGRDNFLHMISRQDRIADYAQNVAEQLSFRTLYENKDARNNLVRMADAVVKTVSRYEDAVEQLKNLSLSGYSRKEKDELSRLIREVNLLEHEADKIERDSAAFVFTEGDEEPLAAMHMYRVLQRLDDVANSCEMAANAFLPIIYD
jgi:predicted phosphate transport protein (TIGR00153 family)